jgi:hypothetical protein
MKKFIIVDTFNGEGYSESKAEIKEFKSVDDAQDFAWDLANEFCSCNGSAKLIENRVEYGVNLNDEGEFEDYGAVHFVEFEDDMLAVVIEPTINSFTVIRDEESIEGIEEYLLDSMESQDGEDLEGTCHHLDDETIIYQKL